MLRNVLVSFFFLVLVAFKHIPKVNRSLFSLFEIFLLEVFQVACRLDQKIVLHPFAFRTHTHKLGRFVLSSTRERVFFEGLVVSGYRVRGEEEEQEWTELGRRSPQLPQMFNPIEKTKEITIEQGDYVAAMCSMFNGRSHTVSVG